MHLRPAHLLLSGVLLLAPLAACGKDNSSTSSGVTTSTSAVGTTSGTPAGSSSNDAVKKYCDDVDSYSTQLAKDLAAKDYTAASQLAQSVSSKLQSEGQAAAAEAQAHPDASYAKCQKDASDAAAKIQSALSSSYGNYAP